MLSHIIALVFLVAVCGWLSCVETAVLSVNKSKIKNMAEEGDPKAQKLQNYLGSIAKIMTVIQIGLSLATTMAGAITAGQLSIYLSKFLASKNVRMDENTLYIISFIIILILLTYFMMVFGQLVPKRMGIHNAERLTYKSMGIMKFVSLLLSPFVFLVTTVSNGIVRLMGINPAELDANVTEEEIRMMIDAGGDNGSIDESEKEMINNIFELDDTSAEDIATHRTDIVAVPLDASIEDIKAVINLQKYSRIPVYQDNIDDIVGIFHMKDFVKYILSDSEHMTEEGFHLEEIMMQPYFVPTSKKTNQLFQEMQKEKVHMAIVIDEYGGTAGLVTMEDLLEEIVGNIFDEYDAEEGEDIEYIGEDTYLMKGSTDLEEVEEILGIELEENEDYDTLAGYLIGCLDRIPEEGEHPCLEIMGYSFYMEQIEEKRIETVRVKKLSEKKEVLPE